MQFNGQDEETKGADIKYSQDKHFIEQAENQSKRHS